jgi:hypothetical protein
MLATSGKKLGMTGVEYIDAPDVRGPVKRRVLSARPAILGRRGVIVRPFRAHALPLLPRRRAAMVQVAVKMISSSGIRLEHGGHTEGRPGTRSSASTAA